MCYELTFYDPSKIINIPLLEETFDPKNSNATKTAQDTLKELGEVFAKGIEKQKIASVGCCITGIVLTGGSAGLVSTQGMCYGLPYLPGFLGIFGFGPCSLICGALTISPAEHYEIWNDRLIEFTDTFEFFREYPCKEDILPLFEKYTRVFEIACHIDSRLGRSFPTKVLLMEAVIACLIEKDPTSNIISKWNVLLQNHKHQDFSRFNNTFWMDLGLIPPDVEQYWHVFCSKSGLQHIPNKVSNIFIKTVKEECENSLYSKYNNYFEVSPATKTGYNQIV